MSHTLKCSSGLIGRCFTSRAVLSGAPIASSMARHSPVVSYSPIASPMVNYSSIASGHQTMLSHQSMHGHQSMLGHQILGDQSLLKQQPVTQQQVRCITRGRVKVLREMKSRSRDFDVVPHKLRHRREWLDWNYDCEIFSFNERLKERFTEFTLKKAFIFPSYYQASGLMSTETEIEPAEVESPEHTVELDTNEQFIQAGTELCERFICQYLRYFLRELPEEGIIATKQFLLSEKSLSDMACKIGCKDLILCKEFPVSNATLAATMLSLIGALQHDTDEKHACKFIIDFVMTYLNSVDILDIWDVWEVRKPSLLVGQILATNGYRDRFEYRVLRETGANAILPSYLIGIYVNKKLLGFGPGASIREAKNMAAYDCLRRLFNLSIAKQSYRFGAQAYDLDYASFDRPNQSLADFKVPQLERYLRPEPIAFS